MWIAWGGNENDFHLDDIAHIVTRLIHDMQILGIIASLHLYDKTVHKCAKWNQNGNNPIWH